MTQDTFNVLSSTWGLALRILAYSLPALIVPERWLRNRWVRMRIREGSLSPWGARLVFGVPFTAAGLFVLYDAIDVTSRALAGKLVILKKNQYIKQPPLVLPDVEVFTRWLTSLLFTGCWIAVILIAANGLLALASPKLWETLQGAEAGIWWSQWDVPADGWGHHVSDCGCLSVFFMETRINHSATVTCEAAFQRDSHTF